MAECYRCKGPAQFQCTATGNFWCAVCVVTTPEAEFPDTLIDLEAENKK